MGEGAGDGAAVTGMGGGESNWIQRLLAMFGSGTTNSNWHERLPEEPLSETDRFLVDTMPFERRRVTGNEALAARDRLRAEGSLYPVIVGSEESLIRLAEQWSMDDRSPEEILAAAAELEHPESLIRLRRLEAERMREILSKLGESTDDGEDYQAPLGDWPDASEIQTSPGPVTTRDFRTGEPLDEVYILLVPARHGYEVPAYLRWGGWNECPPPEHHVAALRKWHADHGAELIAITGDVIELDAARLPATRDQAVDLAREQYAYCADIVDQGVRDISSLAALLMASRWWYFWWD